MHSLYVELGKYMNNLNYNLPNNKRILVLTIGSSTEPIVNGLSFLTALPSQYSVWVLGTRGNSSGRLDMLVKSVSQAIYGLSVCNQYDIVISRGALVGVFFSLLSRLIRRNCKHFIFSIGISYIKRWGISSLFGLIVIKLITKKDIVFCHSSTEVSLWKKWKHNAFFFPLTVLNFLSGGIRREFTEDYVFTGGRADRDYTTLIKAVAGLSIKVVIVLGKNPLNSAYDNIPELPQNVILLKDISQRDFDNLLYGATIVVLPLLNTYHNAGQTVLVKAMLAGKPVIATRCVGTVDYVDNFKTGILVPPRNPAALRDAINLLLNKDIRKTLAIRGKRIAESNLSPIRIASFFLSFVE